MIARLRTAAAALPLLLCACSYQSYQSDFAGAAVQNRQFQILFWIFLGICAVMYLFVITFLIAGMLRARRAGEANVVETGRHHESDPLMRSGLIGWAAVIGTGLAALAIASFAADRSMANAAVHPGLSITVTGNQWWWDIQYSASDTSKSIRTANELHLPVGIPTHITLQSNDVIHSFWVPSLAGKQDLIPGRETDVTITPQRVGIYRGQCAEFCGVQHARMALVVNVDSYPDFIKWWDRQMQPAPRPSNPLALAGYNIVTTRQCASCHAITGTPANATFGPDLTHVAGRRSIAAGTLPMSKAGLYGWIADPQAIKPGAKMPPVGLEPNELRAIVAYLETLK